MECVRARATLPSLPGERMALFHVAHVRWPVGAPLLLTALAVALSFSLASGSGLSQPAWPTPPPGPPFPPPQETTDLELLISPPAESSGTVIVVVHPQWPGTLPLLPPVPQTTVIFQPATGQEEAVGLPVRVTFDAGAVTQTVQVRFTPLEAADVTPAWPGAQVLRPFRLEAFDSDANPLDLRVARPIVVTVPVAETVASGIPGDRLLLAALDQMQAGWQPLVTAYQHAEATVEARLLALPATLALVHDSP